ncbi:hypothetical protein [Streptomyces pristinaespiralis]|uniref:hypothetical protein n=1 Tax=Streptomyces pristinaespiralis TaxID=38300 RepID=UPI0033D4D6AA
MEEKPESVERAKERDKDSGNWVLRPDVSNGTSIEIASLTKADHLTPEMLELLHRLMLRVQESEAIEGPVLRSPPDCPRLRSCQHYTLV